MAYSPTNSPSTRNETERRREVLRWLLPIGLALVYLAQCAWFLRTQSLTYDEPVHVAAGLEEWRQGKFEQYNDHPPLVRLLCTLPLLDQRWRVQVQPLDEGFRIPRIEPDPVALAWRARAVNVLFGLALAGLLWWAARNTFSESAANFALALYAFSPPLIAHFSLATTDGAATLFIFAAALAMTWWRENSSLCRTILLGIVLGLLLLAKFSTPVMFVVALVWMLAPSSGIRAGDLRKAQRIGIILFVVFLVVWAGYFFHVSRLTLGQNEMVVTYPHRSDMIYKVHSPISLSLWIPAGEYLEGLRNAIRHNAHGQAAFFLGETSRTGGWKSYFPVVVLLKWPITVLVLFLASLWLMLRRRWKPPAFIWGMASFPAVYFAISLFARFDLGDRHVLPVYPFVILFASATWEVVRQRRAPMIVLAVMLVLHAVDGLRCAPDYLSPFNAVVPPSKSYRLLSDSNLDWGQGLLALRDYQESHPAEEISLAYFGSVEPSVYGIHVRRLAEGERAQGTVIVSATHLSGQYLQNPESYRWLLKYPLVAMLNHSLFVFRVPASAITSNSPR